MLPITGHEYGCPFGYIAAADDLVGAAVRLVVDALAPLVLHDVALRVVLRSRRARRAASPCDRTRARARARDSWTERSRSTGCSRCSCCRCCRRRRLRCTCRAVPYGTWPEPVNITCSNRCAKPVRPACSFFEPTWYITSTATVGVEWSSARTTVRPFGSVYFSNGMRMRRAARAARRRLRARAASGDGGRRPNERRAGRQKSGDECASYGDREGGEAYLGSMNRDR